MNYYNTKLNCFILFRGQTACLNVGQFALFYFNIGDNTVDNPHYIQVHPKLNQMDQDKVARIYSDLRKESIVRTVTKNILLHFCGVKCESSSNHNNWSSCANPNFLL